MVRITEIFHSIQGEGSRAGLPCVFIRLTGCNLRCSYCDTAYAFHGGAEMSRKEIIEKVKVYNCHLVEITGGEPLTQQECFPLMKELADEGFDVMLETGGSISVADVDSRVKIIMDVKCPSSRMDHKNRLENFNELRKDDEVKFVIGDRTDFDFALDIIKDYIPKGKFVLLFSPVFGKIKPVALAEWLLESGIQARLQLQLHKYIWDPERKGV